ncbi:MAG: 1-acyl-sn-glycerol-3-phosphate acyltransferase [Anaerolineae bacterium]|nr:1-acyl-sn-glycerol-3-phosphate acyltransferase [Anaerolineae bacterium]
MTTQSALIPYPRKPLLRGVLRFAGRTAMSLLSRTEVNGAENLPKNGPLILVGNHVAFLEAVMMVLYVPWLVEVVGTGEIPLDPRYAPLIHTYGYIPIRRGDMDREALNSALGVLKQGGVVGIFPEGGIWESATKKARTGVSWLSYQSEAPLLPIGFGGIDGAIGKIASLKRPRLVMNIGNVIPPIRAVGGEKSRKVALEEGAQMIMSHVEALVPEEDKRRWNRIRDERFELRVTLQAADGSNVNVPDELRIQSAEMLSKLFHRPLMLDVFTRNLKLPVHALQNIHIERDPQKLADAADVVLDYLTNTNPHFLTYRFGYDQGAAMQRGVQELRDLARWAQTNRYQLEVTAIRRYRKRGSDEEYVENRPGELPAL